MRVGWQMHADTAGWLIAKHLPLNKTEAAAGMLCDAASI
jgi:hypothetical protein